VNSYIFRYSDKLRQFSLRQWWWSTSKQSNERKLLNPNEGESVKVKYMESLDYILGYAWEGAFKTGFVHNQIILVQNLCIVSSPCLSIQNRHPISIWWSVTVGRAWAGSCLIVIFGFDHFEDRQVFRDLMRVSTLWEWSPSPFFLSLFIPIPHHSFFPSFLLFPLSINLFIIQFASYFLIHSLLSSPLLSSPLISSHLLTFLLHPSPPSFLHLKQIPFSVLCISICYNRTVIIIIIFFFFWTN
jgi:hypothetical protein